MANKKKTVKKTVKRPVKKTVLPPAKSPNVTLWNQGKRCYQTNTESVVQGGLTEETTQGKKLVTIRAGEKCTVTRAYGEDMAKRYPLEILILE